MTHWVRAGGELLPNPDYSQGWPRVTDKSPGRCHTIAMCRRRTGGLWSAMTVIRVQRRLGDWWESYEYAAMVPSVGPIHKW